MNIYEAIEKRKSVRSFINKDISDEVLNKILNAARLAPSANNKQEWRFIVVRDKQKKAELSAIAFNQKSVAEASVVLVCCGTEYETRLQCGQRPCAIDVSIAIDHITLCSIAEGIGTCWIGHFDEEPVKELLNIPENVRVIELLPMGYFAESELKEKKRLPFHDIIMYESWNNKQV